MISRADRSPFPTGGGPSTGICSIGLIVLLLSGVVLSFAGSPPVAERLGYDSFHFVLRHVVFFLPALGGADRDLVPDAAAGAPRCA